MSDPHASSILIVDNPDLRTRVIVLTSPLEVDESLVMVRAAARHWLVKKS